MKKLYVIGIGPGGVDHMTKRAKDAILESDYVVGYTPYLNYIKDYIKGKETVSTGMMREVERCSMALEKVKEGNIVSLVSTGDAGLYAMAALALELVNEEEEKIEVEVVPGVSAAFAAASIVGSPLTHDTALISLSDLLTPLDKILKRVEHAALADFVLVFYNPKSTKRIEPFNKSLEILLKHLPEDRVCVIAKNALREGQDVRVTTLGKLKDEDIDMNTTIIIGNESTYVKNGYVITPRGYKL